jgi:hypothetical protein
MAQVPHRAVDARSVFHASYRANNFAALISYGYGDRAIGVRFQVIIYERAVRRVLRDESSLSEVRVLAPDLIPDGGPYVEQVRIRSARFGDSL